MKNYENLARFCYSCSGFTDYVKCYDIVQYITKPTLKGWILGAPLFFAVVVCAILWTMIYWNADLAAKIACTRQEMETLPPYIDHLLEVSRSLGKTGIHPTTHQFASEKDAFLRYGLLLVSEGLAGEILEEILSVLLYVSDLKGIDFLRQCVAAEAILSIANGEDEDTMLRKLLPYCGIDRALAVMTKRKSDHAD